MRIALIITIFFSLHSLSLAIRWSTGGIVSRYNNIGHSKSVFPFTGFNLPHDHHRRANGFRNSYDFLPPSPQKPINNHRQRNSAHRPPSPPPPTTPKCKTKLVKPPSIVHHEPPKQSIAQTIIKPEIRVEPMIFHQRSTSIITSYSQPEYTAPKQPPININPQPESHITAQILKQDIIADPSIFHQKIPQQNSIAPVIITHTQPEYAAPDHAIHGSHPPPEHIIAPLIKPTEIIADPSIVHHKTLEQQQSIVPIIITHTQPEYAAPNQEIRVNHPPTEHIIAPLTKPEVINEPSIFHHLSPAQSVEPIIITHTPPEEHHSSPPKPLPINTGNNNHAEPVGILRQHNFIGNHGFSYSTTNYNNNNNYKLPYSGSVYGYGIPSFGKKYDNSSPLREPVHHNRAPKRRQQPKKISGNNKHKHSEPNGILYMYNFIGNHGFAYTTNYDKNYVLPYSGSVYGYGLPSFGRKYVSPSTKANYESPPKPPKGFKASTGGIVWRYNNLGYLKYGLPYQGYKLPYDSSVFGYGIPTNGKSYDHKPPPLSPPHKSAKIESIDEDVWKYIHVGYQNYGTPYSGYTIPYDSSVFGYGIPYFGKPDGHVAQNYGNVYTSHDDTIYDKTVGYKSPYYTNIYGYGVPFVGNEGVCNDAHQRYMFERLGILVCNDAKK